MTDATSVTMRLTPTDMANANFIRETLNASNNAHVVSIALSLTEYLVWQLEIGNDIFVGARSGLRRLVMDELEPARKKPQS